MKAFVYSCFSLLLLHSSANAQSTSIKDNPKSIVRVDKSLFPSSVSLYPELLSPSYCLEATSWEKNRVVEIQINQNKLDKNIADLEYVLEIYPDDIVSLYNLAVLQFKSNQQCNAERSVRKALLAIDALSLEKLKETDSSHSTVFVEPEKLLKLYKTIVREKVVRFQKYLSDSRSKTEKSMGKQN